MRSHFLRRLALATVVSGETTTVRTSRPLSTMTFALLRSVCTNVDPAIVADEVMLDDITGGAGGGSVAPSPVTRTTTDDVRVAFGE